MASKNPVLADSSFYIRMAREGRDPLKMLAFTAADRDLATCGMVRCEVGSGIRDARVLAKFRAFWDRMLCVPTDNRVWDAAERLLWDLDRRGHVLPLPDAVIAVCALRLNATVLTLDTHFRRIPGLRLAASIAEL